MTYYFKRTKRSNGYIEFYKTKLKENSNMCHLEWSCGRQSIQKRSIIDLIVEYGYYNFPMGKYELSTREEWEWAKIK